MPRFPFRRSVGEDLRDLFGHDRLKDQERGLGYSSISPGEGSLDILDANGGTVARFGHEGAASGFLVRRGSDWVRVQDWVTAEVAAGTAGLDSRVGTLEGRADSHASRIGGVENRATSLEGRADSHVSRIGALEGRADAHAQRIGAAEGDISDVKSMNSTQNGRLDSHASRLGAVENKASATSSKLNTVIDRLNDLEDFVAGQHPSKPIRPPIVKD